MTRVFVTGSADGLGRLTAQTLLHEGHRVVVHVRSPVGSPRACTSGGYWHHQRRVAPHPSVNDVELHERLLDQLARATGTQWPGPR